MDTLYLRFKDYLTIGRTRPQLDSQQDWTLSYSREENGVTTLRFYRKRDTGDAVNDTVIQVELSFSKNAQPMNSLVLYPF